MPIWDINNSNINDGIYIGHSAVGYGSGESILEYQLKKLRGIRCSTALYEKVFHGYGNGWPVYLSDCGNTCMMYGTKLSIIAGTQYIELDWRIEMQKQMLRPNTLKI